jgi:hypothetical protein
MNCVDYGKFYYIQPLDECSLMVTCLVNTVFSDDEKRALRAITLELGELRKLLMALAEMMVKMSDKELLETLNASKEDIAENKVANYKEKLEKQIDVAERELRS